MSRMIEYNKGVWLRIKIKRLNITKTLRIIFKDKLIGFLLLLMVGPEGLEPPSAVIS